MVDKHLAMADCSSSSVRAAAATLHPSAASALATARPIPRPAPVISAVRPFSPVIVLLPVEGCRW